MKAVRSRRNEKGKKRGNEEQELNKWVEVEVIAEIVANDGEMTATKTIAGTVAIEEDTTTAEATEEGMMIVGMTAEVALRKTVGAARDRRLQSDDTNRSDTHPRPQREAPQLQRQLPLPSEHRWPLLLERVSRAVLCRQATSTGKTPKKCTTRCAERTMKCFLLAGRRSVSKAPRYILTICVARPSKSSRGSCGNGAPKCHLDESVVSQSLTNPTWCLKQQQPQNQNRMALCLCVFESREGGGQKKIKLRTLPDHQLSMENYLPLSAV